MTIKKPIISIITVVYNGEHVIEPTIKSVINQSMKDFEYLIIDGASSDNTLIKVNAYKNQISAIYSEKDSGVYDAMNKGLNLAKGKYILFLNAGDELAAPDTLDAIFTNCNGADLIYGETLIMTTDKEVIGNRTELTSRKLPKQLKKEDFLNGQVVSHQSFIPKIELCKPYNLLYKCSSDINWMLEIIDKCKTIKNSGVPISKYLQGGISDTQLVPCWKERFIILFKHFGLPIVLWQHVKFAIRYLKMGAYRRSL